MDKDDKAPFAKAREMFGMPDWIAPASDATLWLAALQLPAEQGVQPASKVYRNLKFFNSTASDLKSAMLFMSASLGVGCSHCHVAGAWEKDDNPAKKAARSMLALVRDARDEFTGIRIGCPTCHHGAGKPELAPQ